MAKRGVLYIAWGERTLGFVERSVASLKRHHPELPVHIETLPPDTHPDFGLKAKTRMGELSPFETTLFLDADTIVLDRLDYAFDKAERFGVACSICECPWARRFAGIGSGDMIEYNTGVLFFSAAARPLFAAWEAAADHVDSATVWVDQHGRGRHQPYADQGSFAYAVEASGINPFVLPFNWNFRPEWHRSAFAPIKVWHDYRDVPPALAELSRACAAGERPVQYVEFARPAGAR